MGNQKLELQEAEAVEYLRCGKLKLLARIKQSGGINYAYIPKVGYVEITASGIYTLVK